MALDSRTVRVNPGFAVTAPATRPKVTAEDSEVMGLRHEDYDLAARMIAGDESAFERFSEHHIPALYRFAMRRLHGDRELAGEVTQSTVCKAIAKLDTYRGGSAIMTWLCAICRTEIALHFRKKGRRGIELEVDSESLEAEISHRKDGLPSPEAAAISSEAAGLVHVVLDLLPTHYSQVLEWKYLRERSVKVMAKRLKMTDKATESLLTRARNAFRRRYEELNQFAGPEPASVDESLRDKGARS